MWAIKWNHWALQRDYTPSGIVGRLDSLRLDLSWRWDEIRYFFTRSCRIDVCGPGSRSTWAITACDDQHPQNGTKVMLNPVEMRAGKILPIKEVRWRFVWSSVEGWMGIPQIPELLVGDLYISSLPLFWVRP